MDLVESSLDDLRFARRPRTWALLTAPLVLLAVLPWAAPASWTVRATMVWIYAIGVLGQSLLIGHTGQVSFGQAGFLAIGAYAFAHLRQAGVPALPAILAGGLAAALFGVLLGLPALRLKGPYLAIATLGFGVAVYQALASFEWLSGGRTGLDVPRLEPMLGLSRGLTSYYLYLAVLLAFMAATWNLLSSYVGRAFAAIRDSDVAAEATGINLTRYKLLAFALSSFYTGVHGGLFAQFLVGGLVFVEGAVLGAAFVVLLPTLFNQSGWLVPVVFGFSLIVVMLFEPLGLAGRWSKVRLYFETWPFR